jgi:hypothetical protein
LLTARQFHILGAQQLLMRRSPLTPLAQPQFYLFTLLALLMAGCSVLFVSPYDEMTDRAISDLVVKTETFLGRYSATTNDLGRLVKAGRAFDDEAAKFYNEARGATAAIRLRSEQKDKNEEEIKMLRDLSSQYDRLEASHRLGTITKQSAKGLHTTLRSLLQVQLTKKHIGTYKTNSSSPAPNP